MKLLGIWSFLLLFKPSLECGCPSVYTQQIVCYSDIIMKARIDDIKEEITVIVFDINIIDVYKGKDLITGLSDNTTLRTPKDSGLCGPLTLVNGTTYIMTANVHEDGFMYVIFCDYIREDSRASSGALLGIEGGEYFRNCDCKIPYDGESQPLRRGRLRCGYPPRTYSWCGFDALCAKNSKGRCKWQNCSIDKERGTRGRYN